jgi:hypothetical protein
MNTQHSPGPWTEWQGGIFDVDSNLIASVSQDGQWNWIEGSNVECAPGEANINLMAAALELREALEDLLECTEGQALYSFMEPQRQKARAAIAKSKGETK